MDNSGKFLGLIAFIILIMFAISIIPFEPMYGLVVLFSAILILAIIQNPGSAQALIKLFMPIMLALLVVSVLFSSVATMTRDTAILITLGFFVIFLLVGASSGATEIKSLLALAPLVVVPTMFALLLDPTGFLAVMISSIMLFSLMMLIYFLTRNLGGPTKIGFASNVGVVVEDLAPKGKVRVGNEIWWATTRAWKIPKGTEVYIIDSKNLELIVVPVVRCPICGEPYPIIRVPPQCKNCGADLITARKEARKKWEMAKLGEV
ncbi:MAG: NfeD family protein [Candidatus Njordarchaeum guaymaensis]